MGSTKPTFLKQRLREQVERLRKLAPRHPGLATHRAIGLPLRADVLARVQSGLGRLAPEDYLWEGEIICAVATKGAANQK